ncbi:hypothetical protein DNU06_00010 [Putridiphycobacter roseus]|uniref:Peptidase M14 domain-containing protein n=1 Tax=Putridiphycobacter roseus TaxID=2219161 RepID=A0A2W1N305_9FLAO|nr:M14 family zinc carboxypeptidase [Putridiphycobacter roseus]PZE18254.1 hypothetical protein DNU06_00010 [Putridiphycobacter roseus]
MIRSVLLFFLLLSFNGFAQSLKDDALRPPIYQRVGISLAANEVLETLHHLGIDLSCGATLKQDSIFIELNEVELAELSNHQINYQIIIPDLTQYYSDRAVENLPQARLELEKMKLNQGIKGQSVLKNVGQYNSCDEIDWDVPSNWHLNPQNSPNSFGGCLTNAQVMQELDEMRAQYPNLISLKLDASPINQTTIQGNTIYYVRISDNPDVDEPNEPEALYQSLIHCREASSVMQLLYYMWYLLEHYDSDESIQYLLNNQALFFIPVFNPDGFLYNEAQSPNGGGMQRKNMNGGNACGQFSDGIDLNRNSAYYWGNGGSSTSPCNATYMGTAPFSENETQIMRDFFLQHDFKLSLNHHSYKNAMLHAYAGTAIPNPRAAEYAKYSHDMSFYNRYAYGPSSSISALNSGNMNDWMQGGVAGVSANGTATGVGSGKHTLAWTPENGNSNEGGFWPTPSNFVHIAKRAMRMNFLAAYYSGTYAKLHDLNKLAVDAMNDSLFFGIENLGQTQGVFTVTVNPLSSNVLSVGPPVIISGMNVLEQSEVGINFILDPNIQINDTIQYLVTLTNNYGSDSLLFESTITQVYKPSIIFKDDPDFVGLTNWTEYGGSWYLSPDAFSGSQAISSTNTAPYLANQSKSIQLNNSFDLSVSSNVHIQFYTKWDLERSFDYVQFEVSTDGLNWSPLCGKLTKPGGPASNSTYSNKSASNGFQPEGAALYDGDMNGNWQQEEILINIDHNSFFLNQSTVYFRFNMNTDYSNQQSSYSNANFEGFSFDDFTIYNALENVLSTGIESVNQLNLAIYPSPFTDEVNVTLHEEEMIHTILIYQVNGQLIYQEESCNAFKMKINTREWSSGIYFIQVNEKAIHKMVKF